MRIPNLPPLQCLLAFEAAIRNGSITRTAAELNLTPSAVSRQIAQLEQFLGRTLFIREKRLLRLTLTGHQYGAQVHALLTECSRATTDIMKTRGRLDLTIACASGTATFWLAPRIGDFMKKHSEIKLRIISRDAITAFSTAEFDIGIYYLREGQREGLSCEHLLDGQVSALCAPGYLNGEMLPPAELINKTLLLSDDQLWMNWTAWFTHCGVEVHKLKHLFTTTHYTMAVQMALLGNGILLGWQHTTAHLLQSGSLVKASSATVKFGGGYYLVWPNNRSETKAEQLFKAWLLEQTRKVITPTN
jgi:DNA-binding transcriptional LysR family regulator